MTGPRATAFLLLVAALVTPSIFVVQAYLGSLATAALLVVGPALIAIALHLINRLRCPERWTRALTLLLFLAVVALVLYDYPRENVHAGGLGMDRDDALDLATSALLRGEFPYRQTTYLGNPITPCPGGLLLSAPFTLLGGAAYGNLFWLAVLVFLLARASWWSTLVFLAATVLTPASLHALLHGDDFLANSVSVLAGFVLALETVGPARVASLVLLGVALSWRMSFIFVLPVLGWALVDREGWRKTAVSLAVVVGVFALVTLPFAVHDWSGFSPFHILKQIRGRPGGLAAPWLALLLGVVGGAWARTGTSAALGIAFAVLWFPSALVALGTGMLEGEWGWLSYTGLPLPFALLAAAYSLRSSRRTPGSSSPLPDEPSEARAAHFWRAWSQTST